jgi:hypothetical protein
MSASILLLLTVLSLRRVGRAENLATRLQRPTRVHFI